MVKTGILGQFRRVDITALDVEEGPMLGEHETCSSAAYFHGAEKLKRDFYISRDVG
jgi:hypothetical protein